jgi:hypothetical protein
MRELPILFSAPMVRAILEGRKTVTRRVVKPQPVVGRASWTPISSDDAGWVRNDNGTWRYDGLRDGKRFPFAGPFRCPYGELGDRLYVRETTVNVEDHGYLGPVFAVSDEGCAIRDGGLAPDPDDCTDVEPEDIKLRPAVHMPKSWARIWLEVTTVRVERLQDITAEQVIAEGLVSHLREHDAVMDLRHQFADLWDAIAKIGARWFDNPCVWVVEYKRIEKEAAKP